MAIHNHYDNLKVARNAPPEVIRAAYKALSQKWHPDRNADTEAHKYMAIINAAYAVLSDPVKRKEHDDWLSEQEAEFCQERSATVEPEKATSPTAKRKRAFDIDDTAHGSDQRAETTPSQESKKTYYRGGPVFLVCLLAGILSGR